MDNNESIWNYYTQDGSKHVDAMYRPYCHKPECGSSVVELHDGTTVSEKKSKTIPRDFYATSPIVNPEKVRVGWSLNFTNRHPDDPCPSQWSKHGAKCVYIPGHVLRAKGLYSDETFQMHPQFPAKPGKILPPEKNRFAARSVNPYTGKYDVLYPPGKSKLHNYANVHTTPPCRPVYI